MSARAASRLGGLLTWALCAAGCAAAAPPALDVDRRWIEVMDDGEVLPVKGVLHAQLPSLGPPRAVELDAGAPVSVDRHGRSTYWPQALPAEFEVELREVLSKNTGFEVSVGDERGADTSYDLELRITRYCVQLVEVGLGSGIAPFWLLLPHLASFYNAPDEFYRVEYELEATWRRAGGGAPRRATLRGSKTLALTDFQRGWTLFSLWPEQRASPVDGDRVEAWQTYAEDVIASVEPFARRALLIELMRFVRTCSRAEQPGPRTTALVAGVEHPADAQPVPFAVDGTAAITSGLALVSASPVLRFEGSRARADSVQRALWEQVGRLAPGDVFLFCFVGRGGLVGGAPAVVFADRACRLEHLLEPLRAAARLGAHPIAVLDAALFGGRGAEDALTPAATQALIHTLSSQLEGVTLWIAGGSDPRGAEADPSGGRFYRAFVRGLGGAAESDGDGNLSLAELGAYLRKQPESRRALFLGDASATAVLAKIPKDEAAAPPRGP